MEVQLKGETEICSKSKGQKATHIIATAHTQNTQWHSK